MRLTQEELAEAYRQSTYLPIGRRREVKELGILKADSEPGKAAGLKEDMCVFEDLREKGEGRYLSTQQRLVRFDIEIHQNDGLRAIQEREEKRREELKYKEIERKMFPKWYDKDGYRLPDADIWAIINSTKKGAAQ